MRVWHVLCLYLNCKGKRHVEDLRHRSPQPTQVVLEGKLVAPWITELRTACENAKAQSHRRELVIDIKNLVAISQEGENLLVELMKQGTKFRSRGVFTKHVLAQLAGGARRNVKEP